MDIRTLECMLAVWGHVGTGLVCLCVQCGYLAECPNVSLTECAFVSVVSVMAVCSALVWLCVTVCVTVCVRVCECVFGERLCCLKHLSNTLATAH